MMLRHLRITRDAVNITILLLLLLFIKSHYDKK